jgi:hypothetical protein
MDGEAAEEMAALIRQAQQVWMSSGDKACCSHRLGSTWDNDPPLLMLIRRQGDQGVEVVKRLLDAGGAGDEEGVAWLMATDLRCGGTPLYWASQQGRSEVVGQLLAAKADVNQARTDDGSTPLLSASQNGHHEVVARLLANGAAPNVHMESNVSPLMCAAWGGHLQCVEQLLAAGADRTAQMTGANAVIKADAGTTAKQLADREGHTAVSELLAGR